MIGSPISVGVICDLVEERWPSMDLVADRLLTELHERHADRISATQLRPSLVRRASRFPVIGASARAWNADRLANRFLDYPRWLKRRAGTFDLYHIVDHSYSQLVHVLPAERTVVTCHDLDTFRSVLERSPNRRGRLFRAMTRRILDGMRKAARVTCDSHATRDAVLSHGLVPPDRLDVVYLGVSPLLALLPTPEVEAFVGRLLGPPQPDRADILHVGSTIPRKRIDVLLATFAVVRAMHPQTRLVRVGGAFTPEQSALAQRLGLPADSIVVVPYLDQVHLAAVYRRATVVLQTSEAEGFGLPVAEAMSCGTPVVASDLAVLREVGGEAASYSPVGDISHWAATVSNLLATARDDGAAWEGLRARSVQQASRFSWAAFARQMVAVYDRVLSQ